MGARNVIKVYTYWSDLGHREGRALGYMAVTALDADKPPIYYGGWEAVAQAIGLKGSPTNAKEQFRRIIKSLTTAGAVVSSGNARIGFNAEYALALDPDLTYEPEVQRDGKHDLVVWNPIQRGAPKRCPTSNQKGAPLSTEKVERGAPKRCPQGEVQEDLGIHNEKGVALEGNSPEGDGISGSDTPTASLTYEQARKILGPLPNLGREYLDRVDPTANRETRMIEAAKLYLKERRHES